MSRDQAMDVAIYAQDCENYRYQDQLKWSRFKVVGFIEVGICAAALHETTVHPLAVFGFVVFAGLLAFILLALTIQDALDARVHLGRLMRLEEEYERKIESSTQVCPGWQSIRHATWLINLLNLCIAVFCFIRAFWPGLVEA